MGTSLVKFNKESNPTKRISNKEEEIISNKFDVVGHLPPELAQKIFLQLSPDDLRSAALCCLNWKAALSSEYLWKIVCRRDGYLEVEESNRSAFYTNFMKRYSYWQGVYWYNQTLQRNWETNNYTEVIYELDKVYFFSGMMKQCLYDDVFVCTNKNWKKLYVYNLNNKEPKVFSIPERSFGCITPYIWKSGKYLIYLRNGADLTVWDLENGSIALDESWVHVTKIHVDKNLFVLESCDDKFEVFNIETGRIEYDCSGIFMNVDIIDGRILYTTEDYVIHILKWEDKFIETITCCNDLIQYGSLIKNDLLLNFCKGYEDEDNLESSLCVWNITSKTKLHSIFLGDSFNYFNERFMNKYLILISYNQFIDFRNFELWDYMTGTQEAIVASKKKIIGTCFQRIISNDYVMAVPRSFKTGVWCLKTKSFVWDLNLHSWRYQFYDLEITKTKLAYAIGHDSKMGGKSIFLHIRDFEI